MSKPFDHTLIDQVDRWSKHVLLSSAGRSAETLALAAFFAKRNIMDHGWELNNVAPVGYVVHYAPKNVDTTFAYVLLMSVLCGNANTVRLTSDSAVRQRQLDLIHEIQEFAGPICVASMGDNDRVNAELAEACDLRVIWGGDDTIDAIRRAPVKPWAREVTFHDRRSIAVLDARMMCSDPDACQKLTNDIMWDIMWMEQASCTSVRGIVWLGSDANVSRAISAFRLQLETGAVERLERLQVDLAKGLSVSGSYDGLLNVRCSAQELERCVRSCSTPGVVYHTSIDRVTDLPWFGNRALQTIVVNLSKEDEETLHETVLSKRTCDRVVRPGRSMEFDWVWDGYDLIAQLTHRVVWNA